MISSLKRVKRAHRFTMRPEAAFAKPPKSGDESKGAHHSQNRERGQREAGGNHFHRFRIRQHHLKSVVMRRFERVLSGEAGEPDVLAGMQAAKFAGSGNLCARGKNTEMVLP